MLHNHFFKKKAIHAMNDIETFLNQRNHAAKSDKVSVLEPYKDEILQLKNIGYAEKIIVKFLSEMKGVNVSRQAVNQFIRSRRKLENKTVEHAPELPKNRLSNRSNTKPVQKINTGFQRFNSREEINLDDLV